MKYIVYNENTTRTINLAYKYKIKFGKLQVNKNLSKESVGITELHYSTKKRKNVAAFAFCSKNLSLDEALAAHYLVIILKFQ